MLAAFIKNPVIDFGQQGRQTWEKVLSQHSETRESHVFKLFSEGVNKLGITADSIPDLNTINPRLYPLTQFQGVFVDGLEDGQSFYKMLSARTFPVGGFIRDHRDLSYTPEPDVIHDLYGHLPFLADPDYADFCQRFGALACEFLNREDLLRQFERFFWFTIEFGLIKTPVGRKVFGAGIASSTGECEYALSSTPTVVPFDVDEIRKQEFRIDIMQEKLFLLDNVDQLYSSLDNLGQKVAGDA